MRLWRRTKAAVAVVAAMALMYGVAGAANLCTLTGNLTLVDGQAGANAQVFFQTISTQSFGGTVIPPSSF
jgi:anti-sigma-K factor RskA